MPKLLKPVPLLPSAFTTDFIALVAEHAHDSARSFLRLAHKRDLQPWAELSEVDQSRFLRATSGALSCVSFRNVEHGASELLALAVSDDLAPLVARWSGFEAADCVETFARAILNALYLLFDAARARVIVVPMSEARKRSQGKRRKRSAKAASGHQ